MDSSQASSSANDPTSASVQTFDDVRNLIIRELRADGLSEAEQNKLMQEVGSALIERVSLALMRHVPPEVLVKYGDTDVDMQKPDNAVAFLQSVTEHVPDMDAVVTKELKAGLKAYQDFLDKKVAQHGA